MDYEGVRREAINLLKDKYKPRYPGRRFLRSNKQEIDNLTEQMCIKNGVEIRNNI